MINEKGLTLVEVMIATSIMSVIMMSIMMALVQGNDQVAYELPRDELEQGASAVLERLELILRNARYFGASPVSADGTAVTFQVLVEDVNGDVVDANFNPVWGVVKGLGTRIYNQAGVQILGSAVGGTGTISYVKRRDARGDVVLSEPLLQANINVNTEVQRDMTDVFDLGDLVFSTNDGWSMNLGNGWILQPRGTPGGDIDGDGAPDPIFRRTGDQIEVRLWVGRAPAGVGTIFMGSRTRVLLRNQ